MVRLHLDQHHFRESKTGELFGSNDREEHFFSCNGTMDKFSRMGMDKLPPKIKGDDRVHGILHILGAVTISMAIISFLTALGVNINRNLTTSFISSSKHTMCVDVPRNISGVFMLDSNGFWQYNQEFTPSEAIVEVTFKSHSYNQTTYEETMGEMKEYMHSVKNFASKLTRIEALAFASTASKTLSSGKVTLRFTANPRQITAVFTSNNNYILANSNFTNTYNCATNLRFTSRSKKRDGEITTTYYQQSPTLGDKSRWDVICEDLMSTKYLYLDGGAHHAITYSSSTFDTFQKAHIELNKGNAIKIDYQISDIVVPVELNLDTRAAYIAWAVNTGVLSIDDLSELPDSRLLQMPYPMYTFGVGGGRVSCSTDLLDNKQPLCFALWAGKGGALGLPLLYSLSTNPRSGIDEGFMCDCSFDRSDSTQSGCNGAYGPNTVIGMVFLNYKGSEIPDYFFLKESTTELASYVKDAGSYHIFMKRAWSAVTIGYVWTNLQPAGYSFKNAEPSAADWQTKFDEAFAFCGGRCSVYRNIEYGIDNSVTQNSFVIQNSCDPDPDFLLLKESVWDQIERNPPSRMHENYYNCKQTSTQAVFSSVGISVGVMNGFTLLVLNLLIPMIIAIYLKCKKNERTFYFGEKYNIDDIQGAIEELGLHILRVRDGDMTGINEAGHLQALSKDLISTAKATYDLAVTGTGRGVDDDVNNEKDIASETASVTPGQTKRKSLLTVNSKKLVISDSTPDESIRIQSSDQVEKEKHAYNEQGADEENIMSSSDSNPMHSRTKTDTGAKAKEGVPQFSTVVEETNTLHQEL